MHGVQYERNDIMIKDPYQVLGVSPTDDDETIKRAYRELARKYHPDNYAQDNPLADLANEKMQEINEAYDMIKDMRAGKGGGASFTEVRQMINRGRFAEAAKELEGTPEHLRSAEWHFLMSIIHMRRGWTNDAMNELNTACNMDPDNREYQQMRENFQARARGYGGAYYGPQGGRPQQQAGGCSTCDMCQGLICADCCCECMGGDLISCC